MNISASTIQKNSEEGNLGLGGRGGGGGAIRVIELWTIIAVRILLSVSDVPINFGGREGWGIGWGFDQPNTQVFMLTVQ